MLHAAGDEQVIDHVQGQKRLHRIVREALAALGEAEIAEALGVAEEGAVRAVALLEVRRRVCNGHDGILPCTKAERASRA